jgi:uncharacterized protein (TIGR00369 family)
MSAGVPNVFAEAGPATTGLEQLRALIASKARVPIFDTMGFELVEVDEGRAVFVGTPSTRVYNPIGSVHGGYAAAMLDSACGVAVHSKLPAGFAYTTLELKISYVRGLSVDVGPVRAEGVTLSVGKRVAFSEAKITDAGGRLYASASSTCLVFENKR